MQHNQSSPMLTLTWTHAQIFTSIHVIIDAFIISITDIFYNLQCLLGGGWLEKTKIAEDRTCKHDLTHVHLDTYTDTSIS